MDKDRYFANIMIKKTLPIQKDTQNAVCPLCSSKKGQIIQEFGCQDVLKRIGIAYDDQCKSAIEMHLKQLWGGDSCCYVSCSGCSYTYAHPNIPTDSKFYSIVYADNSNYPNWKWDFEISYNAIKKDMGISQWIHLVKL